MNPRDVLAEAWRTAVSQKIASLLTMIVVAVMCLATVVTVGRSAANDADLAKQMDLAGARMLTIIDTGQLGIINSTTLGVIRTMSTVESAVAFSIPEDANNGAIPGSQKVPMWQVSDVAMVAAVTRGRAPVAGEAAVPTEVQDILRLEEPSGFVQTKEGNQYQIVAQLTLLPGFEDLGVGGVVQATTDTSFAQLRVVISSVAAVSQTQQQILAAFGAVDPAKLSMTSPTAVNLAGQIATRQLQSYNQQILGLILAIGAVFIVIVVLADVLLHRRELGRRRALGATRVDLTVLTVVRTMIPAVAGAIIGSVTALVVFAFQGIEIPVNFTVATAILAVAASGVAAIAPSAWASTRDPVSVLRTP